jgi:hypothetical protein
MAENQFFSCSAVETGDLVSEKIQIDDIRNPCRESAKIDFIYS